MKRIHYILLAFWSFFEANFWFIAPDFLLVIFGIAFPKDWKRATTLALITSLCGGAFYFILLSMYPESLGNVLLKTPFVTERMLQFIEGLYQKYGYSGVLFQSASFMSFKIWTYQAIKAGFDPIIYFPIVMFSRFFRLGGVALVSSCVSRWIRPIAARHPVIWIGIYSLVFLLGLILIEK